MSFQNYTQPKTRKARTCMECACTIQPGRKYHRWQGIYDGDWFTWWHCDTCEAWLVVALELGCGWYYGDDGRNDLHTMASWAPGEWWTEQARRHRMAA